MFYINNSFKSLSRIIVTLLLLLFVFTTSSVYAESPSVMTITSVNPLEIQEADTDTLLGSLSENADVFLSAPLASIADTDITEPVTPLVQSLSMSASSTDALFQGAQYDSFFENSVFVGDSITVGFSNYCSTHADSIATDTTYFLAKASCSATAATSSQALTAYESVMPEYQGKIQYIEDSISQMPNIEKIFICYGMNDLVWSTPRTYLNNMTVLIHRIKEKSPQATIYIISIPCIIEEAESGTLTNATIQAANSLLEDTCSANQWGFINLTEYLMNQNLSICPEYSSDGFIHQNSAAYAVWTKVLRNYAFEGMTP